MNLENNLNKAQNTLENIETPDKILEKIKSPEELLAYMEQNIKYGYVGRENKKIYSAGDPNFDSDFDSEYFLQTPAELLSSKHGVCWDQAELERQWFAKKNFDFKTYFLMFNKEEKNNLPTHTFLTYKDKDKFYWFENSFKANRGISEYDSFDDLILDIKNKHFEVTKKLGVVRDEDFNTLNFYDYNSPIFGSGADEFVKNIVSNSQ